MGSLSQQPLRMLKLWNRGTGTTDKALIHTGKEEEEEEEEEDNRNKKM